MSNVTKFGNKWKLTTIILVVALTLSLFTVLYQVEVNKQLTVAAQPSFIDVTVSGERTKLGVNDPETYTATVASSNSGNLEYSWTITPADNKTKLTPLADQCTLEFIEATEEAYSLSCQVKDVVYGNQGSGSLAVYDPYTSPNLYLGAYGAPYSYLIETDGLGWYRAISGETGQVSWTSTNAATVITQAITAAPNYSTIKTIGSFSIDYSRTGSYLSPIVISKPITIEGTATFTLSNSGWEDLSALIYIRSTQDVTIKGITIDGNKATIGTTNGTYLINGYDAPNTLIDRVITKNCNYEDIFFAGNSQKTVIQNCVSSGNGGHTQNQPYGNSSPEITWAFNWVNGTGAPTGQGFYPSGNYTTIIGNRINNTYSFGVTSYNGGIYNVITDNTFIDTGQTAILIGNAGVSGYVIVKGNTIISTLTKSGIDVYASYNEISNNIITTGAANGVLLRGASAIGNNVFGNTITTESNGLYLFADAGASNRLHDNILLGAHTPRVNVASSATNYIQNNEGFKTEKSGVAEVLNGGYLNHGLAVTPTTYTAVVNSTSDGHIVICTNIYPTSTALYMNLWDLTDNTTFAGTAQVIWSAAKNIYP